MTTLTLFAKDFDETIAFYCKWLGFIVFYEWNKPGEERILRIRNESNRIELSLKIPKTEWDNQLIGRQAGNEFFLGFEIEDLAQVYESLLKRGAPFTRELVSPPFGDFAYLEDPNGNKIFLAEHWT